MTCVQYLLCMCDWCLQIAHSCVSCTLICVRLVALLHCRVGWTSLQQAPVKVAVDEETRKAKLDGLLTVLLWPYVAIVERVLFCTCFYVLLVYINTLVMFGSMEVFGFPQTDEPVVNKELLCANVLYPDQLYSCHNKDLGKQILLGSVRCQRLPVFGKTHTWKTSSFWSHIANLQNGNLSQVFIDICLFIITILWKMNGNTKVQTRRWRSVICNAFFCLVHWRLAIILFVTHWLIKP